jgi:hypothetical protein
MSFTGIQKVGYHATSSLAAPKIETVGFIPDKIFSVTDHHKVLIEAKALSINTFYYEKWLQMRSTTFAKNEADALNHIKNVSSGGQGIGTMYSVLNNILSNGSGGQLTLASSFISEIDNLRQSSSVIYAVDLSSIKRLVQDQRQLLYHFYLSPTLPIPKVSEISPLNIIAKLEIV